jgi:hypothetical protein
VQAASPLTAARPFDDGEVSDVEAEMERILSSPALLGIEALLLDSVSLSSPAGGQVLSRAESAAWLRDHAGPNIAVSSVDPSRQTMLIEVQSEGWPRRDPVEQGRLTFSLRRYAANGRLDEDRGEWRIDVISAE